MREPDSVLPNPKCTIIGHDERVCPSEDDNGNFRYEIRCKRCGDFIRDIKSYYER